MGPGLAPWSLGFGRGPVPRAPAQGSGPGPRASSGAPARAPSPAHRVISSKNRNHRTKWSTPTQEPLCPTVFLVNGPQHHRKKWFPYIRKPLCPMVLWSIYKETGRTKWFLRGCGPLCLMIHALLSYCCVPGRVRREGPCNTYVTAGQHRPPGARARAPRAPGLGPGPWAPAPGPGARARGLSPKRAQNGPKTVFVAKHRSDYNGFRWE